MSAPKTTNWTLIGMVTRHPVVAFLIMVYGLGWSTLVAAKAYLG